MRGDVCTRDGEEVDVEASDIARDMPPGDRFCAWLGLVPSVEKSYEYGPGSVVANLDPDGEAKVDVEAIEMASEAIEMASGDCCLATLT